MTLGIRRDRSSAELVAWAETAPSARSAARAIAIAHALNGLSRSEAARRAGIKTQTLRDAVMRYNAEGVAGLQDRPRSGRPPKLTAQERAALAGLVTEVSSAGSARSTHKELAELLWARFGKRLHPASVRKLLRRMGVPRANRAQSPPNSRAA